MRYTRNGPGSGVSSRLYRNVVASNDFVEAASAFNASYSDSGVWGVYAEAQRNHVPQVAELLASQLNSVAANVDDSELSRARNQAKVTTHPTHQCASVSPTSIVNIFCSVKFIKYTIYDCRPHSCTVWRLGKRSLAMWPITCSRAVRLL